MAATSVAPMFTDTSSLRVHYDAFNRLYNDFILTLCDFFPAVSQLRFYHELFNQFKRADYKLPSRLFLSSIAEHSLQIFNKNESYFIADGGIEVTKTRSRAIIENTIVQEWQKMTDTQKDTVWFYLQQMLITVMNIEDDYEEGMAEQQAGDLMQSSLLQHGVIRRS